MDRFTHTHAVVTGGTSGIGLATARRLAHEGARVLVTGRDPDRLAAADALDGITAVADDATAPDTGTRLHQAALDHLDGRVDALFLNAGLGYMAPVTAVDADHVDVQLLANVRGPLLQVQALEPLLVDGGAVLLNTSVVNDTGMPGMTVYSATKGALRSAMHVLVKELAGRGIRVNAVSPGPTSTNFFTAAGMPAEAQQAVAEQMVSMVPLGRFGSPEEIASAAAFLLSPEASFVTGAELVVDGGVSS